MAHDRYVVIKLAAELTGYTAKAIQRKIQDGVWPEGVMWKKAPDERVFRMDCYHCKTVFEIEQREGKVVHDQRDGDYITHPCPTCGRACNMDIRLGK